MCNTAGGGRKPGTTRAAREHLCQRSWLISEARDTYDDALSSGQQAFLLQESDESRDVFRLSVGSLPAGQKATICLSYVTELAVEADGALRYCLPAILNPRYTPAGAQSLTTPVSGASGEPVPYSLSFSAHLASPSGVAQVKSNCDLTSLEYLRDDKTQAQDTLLLLLKSLPLGCFFNIYGFGSHFEAFFPLIDLYYIWSLQDTLLLLLKSLPLGCFFNIYGFGSHFEAFFPESVEYTQQTMDSALGKVKGMGADFGGTEILEPLKDIYSKACRPGHPRQLFVFTDGEVGNTKDVINEVKKHAGTHRCFTFGIGEGASTALIKGMARAGSGHPEFITGKDRMQPKVRGRGL
ncbi:UNVERIFIED_CONTAM: hypothetical protein FKN15_042401 [Acipenser sinensis]